MKKSYLRPEVRRHDDSEALDPKVTLEILTKLERCGLTNSHFSQLHHFVSDTIRRHLAYCRKIEKFSDGGTNARLQQRLRFLLRQIEGRHSPSVNIDESIFQQLIRKALDAYPSD